MKKNEVDKFLEKPSVTPGHRRRFENTMLGLEEKIESLRLERDMLKKEITQMNYKMRVVDERENQMREFILKVAQTFRSLELELIERQKKNDR